MKFSDLVTQATALLKAKGRVSSRMLRREFALDEETLQDLKFELVETDRLATEEGEILVWAGEKELPAILPSSSLPSLSPPPASYTPKYLAERIRAEQTAMEARGVTDGERKTITALFADLKGSTALIERLDPEEARTILDPALQLMMDAVHRYEGYVAQALGDGIFALFGAPIAHEDHPQRALYAALRMQEEMRRYSDQSRLKGGLPLQLRVGINTGEVVVRSIHKDDLHTDYVPVGHATNLAARMEQMATPGSILVTAHTHKLTDGYFAFKALGLAEIKGVEVPLDVYEVLGAGTLRTKLQVAARRGLMRFVGRQREMEQLHYALAHTKAGHGQIVGVMGEPGLGKSRLFYEFKMTSQSGCLVLEAYSVSHGKASPYLPVIELLKSYFQIQPQDDERTRRQKVIGKVLELDRSLEDTLPYLFALLGVDDQQSSLAQMDAQIRRQRTFDALKKVFLCESLKQPLVLIFEDLHWIDGETQGFLDMLSESVASAKILMLVNYRPEYRHEWGQKTYYTQLRLAPLGSKEAEEFLDVLFGETIRAHDRTVLHPLKQLILEKTQGTPFFMEEIVQELAEQEILKRDPTGTQLTRPVPTDLHIPTTVQGVLAARIDRLTSEEKALLQQLAVIGREFPLSLLRDVVARPEDELYRILSALQHKEFLYEQPAFPEVEYIFKHALTQEVAYSTVLQDRRKLLHEQTAQAIEILFRDRIAEHYSELAHHYHRSGNSGKAVQYLRLAGEQAVQRSANTEAVHHGTTALTLLTALPESAERVHQELQLHVLLGPVFIATKGYTSPEVEHTYLRAQELCEALEHPPQLFQVLWGVAVFHMLSGAYATTFALGERLLSLAHDVGDQSLILEVHMLLGVTSFWSGALVTAREHMESALTHYDPEVHRGHAFLYGQDPAVVSLSYLAWALWYGGCPDQALTKAREMVQLAQTLHHPFSQGMALNHTAWLHQYRGESRETLAYAERAMTLAHEHGFPYWEAEALIFHGWVLTEHGDLASGLAELHEGFAAYQATRAGLGLTYWLSLIASAEAKMGRFDAALAASTEASACAIKNGERVLESELYRIKGELTLQRARNEQEARSREQNAEEQNRPSHIAEPQGEAEACFLKAMEIARKQQAKSLELRAAMSLARLWQHQGKQREAHHLLSDIYNWFTEGFDTKDLQEAKALLQELSCNKECR